MFQDRANAPAPDLYAYKTADESVTNSDVLQDDDHLTVSVKSGRKYVFRVVLRVEGANGDIKVTLNGTCTVSNFWYGNASDGGFNVVFATTLGGTARSFDTAASPGNVCTLEGALEPTSDGTFYVQWAQVTPDLGATTVKKGSHLVVWRLA